MKSSVAFAFELIEDFRGSYQIITDILNSMLHKMVFFVLFHACKKDNLCVITYTFYHAVFRVHFYERFPSKLRQFCEGQSLTTHCI